jgi:hypothetical protein
MPHWLPVDLEAYARLVHTIHTLEAAAAATTPARPAPGPAPGPGPGQPPEPGQPPGPGQPPALGWLFATPDAIAPWDALTPAHRQIDRDVAQAIIDRYQADQARAPAYHPRDGRTNAGLARQLLARAAPYPPAQQARILGFDPAGANLNDPAQAEALVARLAELGRAELRHRLTTVARLT